MIQLSESELQQIREIGERAYPHECCGVMVGRIDNGVKRVVDVIAAENQRRDSPRNRYLITADFLRQLEKELRGTEKSVLGFFHSHPDVPARPSQYDQEHAWPWYSYLIVSVREGQAQEVETWQLADDRSSFHTEEFAIV